MGQFRCIALVGDVVVARGRGPEAAFEAAYAALLTSYAMAPGPVQMRELPIEIREVADRRVYDAAPGGTLGQVKAATAALKAVGAISGGPVSSEGVH